MPRPTSPASGFSATCTRWPRRAAWRSSSSRDEVPLFDRVAGYAAAGVVPGRTAEVIAWARGVRRLELGRSTPRLWLRILCDPQTSGGLLMAVAPERADALADALGARGVLAARVGECVAGEPGVVIGRVAYPLRSRSRYNPA